MKRTFKKAISILLAAMMIFGSAAGIGSFDFGEFSIKAEAAKTFTEGYYTYTVSNGCATITGVDGSISGDVVIPTKLGGYPVTAIGDHAFWEENKITSIVIPEGITTLGFRAITQCRNFTKLTIPDSVISVGDCTFGHSDSLETVIFGANNKLASISNYMFTNCKSLKNITLPSTVTSIGSDAFRDCDSLTSITLPEGLTSIGAAAFWDCDKLLSIAIPDNVTSLEKSAFAGCKNLSSVTFGKNSKLASIGDSVFSQDTYLKNITIPDSVTTIGAGAFKDSGLNSITIGKGVTSIGSDAFWGFRIKDLYYTGKIEDWCKIKFSSYPGSDKFYIDNKLVTELVIPDSVTSIESSAFREFNGLTSVVINDSVTDIGYCVFSDCKNLRNVVIGNGVTDIGQSAFSYCNKLENVTIGSSVTNIGKSAFYACTSLTKVTIPESVTSIDESAFEWCSNITSVTIGKGVTSIWDNAFAECDKLSHVCYTGSEEEWNNIHISSGNNPILKAKIHYNYDPATHTHEHEKTITVKPTCIEKGTAINLCFCGNKATEDVPAKGHTEGDWKTEEYPTCLEEGKKSKYCTVCKELLKSETIPATGHAEGYWDYEVQPTCTEEGKGSCHCKNCGEIYQTKTVPATGHTAGEWEITLQPTTEAEGKKVKACTVCGETVEEAAIAKVVLDDALITPPEATRVNYIESITLTVDESKIPEGGYVMWTADNLNFIYYEDGNSCVATAFTNGDSTFTATVYDAEGNAILTDSQTITARVNFFMKIIAFFKILFGLAQALPMATRH